MEDSLEQAAEQGEGKPRSRLPLSAANALHLLYWAALCGASHYLTGAADYWLACLLPCLVVTILLDPRSAYGWTFNGVMSCCVIIGWCFGVTGLSSSIPIALLLWLFVAGLFSGSTDDIHPDNRRDECTPWDGNPPLF